MIESLILPKAAGLPYGNGDVKHLTNTDANSAQTISFCTRNLAERDNLLASTINQIIAEVNNKEQIIDVQVPRVSLGTGQTLVISNFRIPTGFEARVLNAIVASIPTNFGRLEVLWSSIYGTNTGDTLISTLSEVSGQTTFWPEGQLIIRVTNIGSASIEVFGDVQITMRPVAVLQGSILVPTIGTSGGSGSGESGASGFSGQSGFSGARGASGFSGNSGYSGGSAAAFSITSSSFVMPSSGGNVTINVTDSTWISIGQVVYIETAGYFLVLSTPTTTSVQIQNLGYSGNAVGTIANTQQLSPGGLQGASGATGSSSTIVASTATFTVLYSGTSTGSVGSYQAITNGSHSYTVDVSTVTIGANTMKLIQGQFLLALRSGNLTFTLPAPFTTSNTILDITVDDPIDHGQPFKVNVDSTHWMVTLPAGYTADTRVTISFFSLVTA